MKRTLSKLASALLVVSLSLGIFPSTASAADSGGQELLLGHSAAPSQQEMTFQDYFPDPHFAAAVASHMRRSADSPVTVQELQSITDGLNAGNMGIKDLTGVGYLKNLRELDVEGNQLAALPAQIGSLKRIVQLNVSKNQLTALPDEICSLRTLGSLLAGDNKLATLPAGLKNMPNLVILLLHNNQLTEYPKGVGYAPYFYSLRLDGNRLTSDFDYWLSNRATLSNQQAVLPDLQVASGAELTWDMLIPTFVKSAMQASGSGLKGYWTITKPDGTVQKIKCTSFPSSGSEINDRVFKTAGTYTVEYYSNEEGADGYRFEYPETKINHIKDLHYTTQVTVGAESYSISALTLGGYKAVVDEQSRTITFTLPGGQLRNGKLEGEISVLEAEGDTITFLVDDVEYPRQLGSSAAVKCSDRVYVTPGKIYTIAVIEATKITALSLDGRQAVINEENRTITYRVPQTQVKNGVFTGKITDLQGDCDSVVFLVDGVEYPRKSGESAGIKTGDQVYMTSSNLYTIALEEYLPQIHNIEISESRGRSLASVTSRVDQENSILYLYPRFPQSEFDTTSIDGNLIRVTGDADSIVFLVDGVEYTRRLGDHVILKQGDMAYVQGGQKYTIAYAVMNSN